MAQWDLFCEAHCEWIVTSFLGKSGGNPIRMHWRIHSHCELANMHYIFVPTEWIGATWRFNKLNHSTSKTEQSSGPSNSNEFISNKPTETSCRRYTSTMAAVVDASTRNHEWNTLFIMNLLVNVILPLFCNNSTNGLCDHFHSFITKTSSLMHRTSDFIKIYV